MLRAQARGSRKDFLASRRRDQHLHAGEISRAAFRAVLFNPLAAGFMLLSIQQIEGSRLRNSTSRLRVKTQCRNGDLNP